MMISELLKKMKFYDRFGKSGWKLYKDKFESDKSMVKFAPPELKYPIYIRREGSDFDVFMQVIYHQEYRIHVGFEAEYIIDGGANIGLASVHFKNRFPAAKIIAVEPEAHNYEMTVKNTENYKEIYTENSGLWNHDTHLEIINSEVDSWGFMVRECSADKDGAVSASSIGSLMEKYNFPRIDILKIDIEGSEKELFESNYDEWLSKTKILLIEVHDGMRKGASKTLFRALEKYNYHLSPVGENLMIRFVD